MNRATLRDKLDSGLIDSLKSNAGAFQTFAQSENDSSIIYVLEKFGKITDFSCRETLLRLLQHKNEDVRLLAVKNLAKFLDFELLPVFVARGESDKSTSVRREAVSAIGRLRDSRAIPTLINFLQANDPKITLQAIRGLLVFSNESEVKIALKKIKKHANEQVQEVIEKELKVQEKPNPKREPHDQFPNFLKNAVVHGDVQKTITYIPDESVHLTFTSPPYYNARDYSIYSSYQEYLDFLRGIFEQVHRITKEGRFFVLNTSPVLVSRFSRSHSSKRYPIPFDIHPMLIEMGWEFIDDIVWVKPEYTVKNRNAGFLQHRKPLAYKPNPVTEMLMVYRKKTDKLIDWNIKQYSAEKVKKSKVKDDYETRNVWEISPSFDKVHSAIFPLELCRDVIKFYSFVDDLIFDPFAGSGSVADTAIRMGRNFLMTEQEEVYVGRIKERLKAHNNLFEATYPKFFSASEFSSLSEKEG